MANTENPLPAIRQPIDATVMSLHQSGRISFTFSPIDLITLLI
jgi:hypothetical protein